MRRSEREITDRAAIEAIIRNSMVCRLAMVDAGQPYVVPMSFGYENGSLYFHSALKGRKIDALNSNNRVCFEFDASVEIVKGEEACDWGMRYKSVIGFGEAIFLEDMEEKRAALAVIMRQYSGGSFLFSDARVNRTAIIKVIIERMAGKQSGY